MKNNNIAYAKTNSEEANPQIGYGDTLAQHILHFY